MGGAVAIKVHLKEPRECVRGCDTSRTNCQGLNYVVQRYSPKAKLVPLQDLAELAFRDLKKRKLASYNLIFYNDQTLLKTAVELLNATNDIESQVEKE